MMSASSSTYQANYGTRNWGGSSAITDDDNNHYDPSNHKHSIGIGHSESPLDNLVRRTSSRRVETTTRIASRQLIQQQRLGQQQQQNRIVAGYGADEEGEYDMHRPFEYQTNRAPSPSNVQQSGTMSPATTAAVRPTLQVDTQSPPQPSQPSPLLHSQFTRDSAYSNDGSAYYNMSASSSPDLRLSMASEFDGPQHGRGNNDTDGGSAYRHQYFDEAGTYEQSNSNSKPPLRNSWRSMGTLREPGDTETVRTRWEGQDSLNVALPTVVVSSPSRQGSSEMEEVFIPPSLSSKAGRTPVIKPITANFSRPVRTSSPGEGWDVQGERVTPQLPPDMREQKRVVLERHAKRTTSPQPVQSPMSLYSTYSYYDLDSKGPPTPTEPKATELKHQTSAATVQQDVGPRTPEDYLQLGIQHHEANRMQESVRCFERSANEGGGCGVGMLMYGLALRHGWGCPKNERAAFKWLRKAAESAVDNLERLRTGGSGADAGVLQSELVLAIYEVGQCFFHGWGVVKDQKMGVSYYAVAARLGDADAQADLAFCLANGKGCKKDKKEAARWYREAIKQGQSDVGLAWIYKEKYLE